MQGRGDEAGTRRFQDGQIRHATGGRGGETASDAYRELKVIHSGLLDMSGDLWNWPSAATLTRPSIARILYLANLYQRILSVPGVICEFGAHWGSTSAILTNLRAHFEPYNYSRRLFVFDTFEGFTAVDPSFDGTAMDGDFGVPVGYEDSLRRLLRIHESLSPNPAIEKHKVYAGDASETVHLFLDEHPEAIASMVVFDMDIYRPTKSALTAILPRLTKGSLLVFDELNYPEYPGETTALAEVLGLDARRLERDPAMPHCAWATW